MGGKACAPDVELATLTPYYSVEEIAAMNPNVDVISSKAVNMLFTKMGAESTTQSEYDSAADRLMTILAEAGLARLPRGVETTVATPRGEYTGLSLPATEQICGIARSGGTLSEAVRKAAPGQRTANMFIQDLRPDEDTGIPELLYRELPANIADLHVVLCDPELATGGLACTAIDMLKDAGVKEESILLLSAVSCPEGLMKLNEEFPGVKVITLAVDPGDGIPI